jgi:hypothetical protein
MFSTLDVFTFRCFRLKVTLDVLGLDVLGLDILVLDVLGEHALSHPLPLSFQIRNSLLRLIFGWTSSFII